MRNDVDKEITSKQINQFEVKPIVPHNLQKCTFMCTVALHVLMCWERGNTAHTFARHVITIYVYIHYIIPMTSLPHPLTGDGSGEDSGGVQVSECGGRCRVSEVVGRHEHCLHRGDGAFLCGGDPLLHGTHVGCQGRLVSHGRWNTTQQSRYLR